MAKDTACLTIVKNPAGSIEAGEDGKQQHVEQPQRLARLKKKREIRKLRQGNCEDSGSHRRGKPVRRELADNVSAIVDANAGKVTVWRRGHKLNHVLSPVGRRENNKAEYSIPTHNNGYTIR